MGCTIWTNYEVVELQPWSWITTVLDSVIYCCVYIPCLPCYSSPCLVHWTRPFAYPGVARLHPRFSTYRTRSSAQLGGARLFPSIPNSLSISPLFPWLLLCGSLTPFLPPCFLQDFCQSFSKIILCRLLVPPFIPLESSPLLSLLSSKIGTNATHCSVVPCRLYM